MRSPAGGSRAIGGSAAGQRVVQKIQSILAPEHLAVEHVGGRAEDPGGDGSEAILLVLRARVGALSRGDDRTSVVSVGGEKAGQRRGICEILVLLPDRRKGRLKKRAGIAAGGRDRQHGAIGVIGFEWPMLRLEVKGKAAPVAPAL